MYREAVLLPQHSHKYRQLVGAGLNSDIIRFCQGRIEPPKAARGHATHIDGIVLNVTKIKFFVLCLALSVYRSARTIEVLSTYIH